MVTRKGHSRISRTDNRLEALISGLVDETIDEKLRFVDFENRPLRRIAHVTSSLRHVKQMTEAMLDNQAFITAVVIIVRKEVKKVVDVESKREDPLQKFVKAV